MADQNATTATAPPAQDGAAVADDDKGTGAQEGAATEGGDATASTSNGPKATAEPPSAPNGPTALPTEAPCNHQADIGPGEDGSTQGGTGGGGRDGVGEGTRGHACHPLQVDGG